MASVEKVAPNENIIEFNELEKELNLAIENDAKYWRENDAKFRAINQRVSSYEEFRDIVKAAHLKPLERTEKAKEPQMKSRGSSIWNSLASKRRQFQTVVSPVESDSPNSLPLQISQETERLPTTTHEFARVWKALDICDRLALLKRMGPSALGHLFRTEIPVGILGEIIQALLAFTPSTAEIINIVGLLAALTEAKRFSLSLQFLSSIEKSTCRQLMEKLVFGLENRQQDLAEEGVTEWTIQELREKYQV